MDPAKLQIVIALFEREYPEERIKKAILHCNSVDSAIEWLERESGASAPSTPMSNAVSASAPTRAAAKASRRRLNSKSAEAVPATTRPSILLEKEEQPPAPQSDSKASSRASPAASEGAAGLSDNVPPPQSRSPPASVVASSVVEPEQASVVASLAVEPEQQAASIAGLDDCEPEVTISSEEIPFIEIRPMEPDAAADWWAKARERWPRIRQDLLDQATGGQKRPAPAADDTEDGTSTPKKSRTGGFESPTATSSARPVATPQGSGGSASASAANAGGDEAAGSSEEASTSKARSPPSSHMRVGQFASRSAAALRSPLPASKVSSRRGSWTPGTSPRAQMSHNPSTEMCEICCNDIAKGAAVRLGCRHGWYCQNCMVKHAEARLEVGAAHVACPECAAPIAECNLRKMLPPEIIDRLLARSLEQAVSSTADLAACPTANCPMRVALEPGVEPRLMCTECKRESCLRCGSQPYHKGLTCEEHRERRNTKNAKKAQIKQAEDDESFRQWMEETGTKQCPTCSIAVTKQDLGKQATQYQECHKMLCRNCNTRFCYKCLKILTESFTCGCSIDRHGFFDSKTGKRMDHLRPAKVGRPASKPAVKNKAVR